MLGKAAGVSRVSWRTSHNQVADGDATESFDDLNESC